MKKNTIFLVPLFFLGFIQACKVKVHLDKGPFPPPPPITKFNYSRYDNGVDIQISNCQHNHKIICEFDGFIDSDYHRFDHTGNPYPVKFLLKDEGFCKFNHSLSLYIRVDCTRFDDEFVEGNVTCFDEDHFDKKILTLQTGFIDFKCL